LRKWLVSIFAATLLVIVPMAGNAQAAAFPWGECTYWAAQMRPDIGNSVSGNAAYWATSAANAGFLVNGQPVVGSVAVFQPGVEGAWGAGHVAYVVATSNNGWFQVSEMDYPYFGRVTYRWAHTGWGVSFIH
jgi:surface antigen